MRGRIIKVTGGFYYVEGVDGEIHECRGRGRFRNDGIKPLAGDIVNFTENESLNLITSIDARKNSMIRPAIANVDQVAIVMSAQEPKFSSYLLNVFLALVENKRILPLIVITKCDLLKEGDKENEQIKAFEDIGYKVVRISNETNVGFNSLKAALREKVTVFTGQTGVGKSTTLNNIRPELKIKTQEISKALGRGKHTTRHVELFDVLGGKVADTPGFSSLELNNMTPEELAVSYKQFREAAGMCKFRNCLHDSEDECEIKKLVKDGEISKIRYDDYIKILHKLKEGKKWK